MLSVFALQGPFGATGTAHLDLLTSTPTKLLAVLRDMVKFLKTGSKQNLPVLVKHKTVGFELGRGKIDGGAYHIGEQAVNFPFAFLWVTHGTASLWDHALKRAGMKGGFVIRPIANMSEYNKLIVDEWPIMIRVGDFYPDFIGRADNQLGGVESLVKALEKKLGVMSTAQKRTFSALGVGAGLLIVGAGIFYARSRRQ